MLILLFATLVFLALRIYGRIVQFLQFGFLFFWIVAILIGIALNVYWFVVIYSLYNLFRREHKAGGTPNTDQVQHAGKA